MCHLAGFIAEENVIPFILESLKIQEPIIGGQATGLAVIDENGIVRLAKTIGPVKNFKEKYGQWLPARIGIGHTRYALKNLNSAATNTPAKAHPFWDREKQFVTMHNGTILNYLQFVKELEQKGYRFRSKSTVQNIQNGEMTDDYCDSEIFSFLIEEGLNAGLEMKAAIRKACGQLEGQFAFVVLHPQYPETIFIANWMQPLYVGTNKKGSFFTSFYEGFIPLEKLLEKKFAPPKNVLLTLTRGKVTIETLLEERSPPEIEFEGKVLEELILKALKEEKNDLGNIWLFLKQATKELGITKSEMERLDREGFTFSPIIYSTLQNLEQQQKIHRKREFVWEGGIEYTPRFRFYLNDDEH